MEAKLHKLAALIFAALVTVAVPGTAWGETDIVLDNESSNTEVNTGDSSFTNSEHVTNGSGVSDESPAIVSSAPAVQGFAANASEPIASVADTSSGQQPLTNQATTPTQTEPELLFVGLPVSTSIAP